MYEGVNASNGIGIGVACVAVEPDLSYEIHTPEDKTQEKERFKKALDTFIEVTEQQVERMKETVGENEAAIMSVHIDIATDVELLNEINDLIDDGMCAEQACDTVCEMFANLFANCGDEVLAERAADVQDVRTGLLAELLGVAVVNLSTLPENSIVVVHELTPSMTADIDREHVAAIVTETGGRTSHSAIIARALEIPAVLSVADITKHVTNSSQIIVDGAKGIVIVDPSEDELSEYTELQKKLHEEKLALEIYRGKPTATACGEEVLLLANIGNPEEAIAASENDAEGIGLFRSEFLFMDAKELPSEEEQFQAYQKVALRAKGAPVIIRTLDVGGDKEIPYMGLTKEENPFMGYRAIRYCLNNPESYKLQLRALLRASNFGDVRIMLPLVTTVDELREAKALIEVCKDELRAEGVAFNENIEVGVMMETPAASELSDLLASECDFFSIGTNDLTGYTMCSDRGNDQVRYLYSTYQPAVLRSIRRIIQEGNKAGILVGMCGEAAADPLMIPLLISFGLKEFSVSAPSVLRTRKVIAQWSKADADALADKVMALKTEKEVKELLENSAR